MRRSISVTLEGVSKVFHDARTGRDVAAVAPCDFTIEPDELMTLLGPSGCGKTTMLRMIGGFELPRRGASSSAAATSRRCRPTSATRLWCFRATACSRT